MALKKYTDFAKSLDLVKQPKDLKPLKENIRVKESIPVVKEISKTEIKTKDEKQLPIFNGKIVKFPDNFKPSTAYKILENKNFDKEKLHYIITEQGDSSLLLVKYNQDATINLKEFSQAVIDYYCKSDVLKEKFKNIIVEGNDKYSVIKCIPNIELNGKKAIKIINDDLIKLLK